MGENLDKNLAYTFPHRLSWLDGKEGLQFKVRFKPEISFHYTVCTFLLSATRAFRICYALLCLVLGVRTIIVALVQV